MPSADSQDFLWIAVGDIHDEPERFAQIPELSQADGIIVTGDLTITGGVKQAEQVMKNLAAVLEEAGTTFENAVKTTCFLADMGDFAAFNAVYGKYFTEKPARSCVAVKTLPKNVLVEVEVIAAL